MTRPLIARLGLLLVAVLVAALPVYSQTSVSGHLKDAAGVGIPGSATTFVKFELMYCGLNDAKVSGVAILPGNSYISTPSALGVINIPALYGNDVIACGPTTGGTRWNVTKYVRNVAGAPCRLNISGTTFNLDTATCENAVPPPATPTTNYENISHSWTAPQAFGVGTTFATLDTASPNTWSFLHNFLAGITGTGNIGALTLGSGALGQTITWTGAHTDSALHRFNAGITGTGNTGTLTLGTGALGGSYTWALAQNDSSLHTFNAGIQVGALGTVISDTRELFQSVHYCGSTGTCSNTANIQARFIFGTITLAGGAATLGGIPTANNLILCTCTDQTTASACKAVQVSSTSVAFSGSGADTLGFQCAAY